MKSVACDLTVRNMEQLLNIHTNVLPTEVCESVHLRYTDDVTTIRDGKVQESDQDPK